MANPLSQDAAPKPRGPSEPCGTVEVPAPTAWPMIAALGVTLSCAGLVTHFTVSITGAVLLVAGAFGWFREVLPRSHSDTVPVEPADVVLPVSRAVLRLKVGEMGHRLRYPVEIYPYTSGVWGGLAGAVAMAALACLYGVRFHGSVWYPINLLAAAASDRLASAGTAELAAFHVEGLVLGVIIHGVMSLLVGLLYAALLPMFPRHPLVFGGVVAPLVWTGLIWASLRVVNPALNQRVDWPWFVASQIGFGLAAGLVVWRTGRVATAQHTPLLVRAGIDAPGVFPPKEPE